MRLNGKGVVIWMKGILFSAFLFFGSYGVNYDEFDNEYSNVVIKFCDIYGNLISSDVVLSGRVNEEYEFEVKEIDGYVFKDVIGNKSGVFLDVDSSVTYVYEAVVPVTGEGRGYLIISFCIFLFYCLHNLVK